MSEGRLDYVHHKILDAYNEIEKFLDEIDGSVDSQTIAEIKRGMRYIKLAGIYSYCIELFMGKCCSEDDFCKTIKDLVDNDERILRDKNDKDKTNEEVLYLKDLIQEYLVRREEYVSNQKQTLLKTMKNNLITILIKDTKLDDISILHITEKLYKELLPSTFIHKN